MHPHQLCCATIAEVTFMSLSDICRGVHIGDWFYKTWFRHRRYPQAHKLALVGLSAGKGNLQLWINYVESQLRKWRKRMLMIDKMKLGGVEGRFMICPPLVLGLVLVSCWSSYWYWYCGGMVLIDNGSWRMIYMRLCLTWRRVDKYGLDTAVEVHSPSHLQLMFMVTMMHLW